jgi:hypothetical protein
MRISPIVVRFTVLGQVPSLKNRKRLGRRRNGKACIINSDEQSRYIEQFGLQVPAEHRNRNMGSKQDPLELTVTLFHASWRPDCDIEIICDCLQKSGVVSNDRWIRRKFIYGERIDENCPRAEITLSYI